MGIDMQNNVDKNNDSSQQAYIMCYHRTAEIFKHTINY